MGELLIDVREKERFTRLGIERCKEFNWSKTATLTLNVLSEALNTGCYQFSGKSVNIGNFIR